MQQRLSAFRGTFVCRSANSYSSFTDERGRVVPGGTSYRAWFVESPTQAPTEVRVPEDHLSLLDSLVPGEVYDVEVVLRPRRNRLEQVLSRVAPAAKKSA